MGKSLKDMGIQTMILVDRGHQLFYQQSQDLKVCCMR